MNETISMTDILLAVSVGCNLWFLFLLLYERIMDTRLVRFFKGIAGLWRSLDRNGPKSVAAHEEVSTAKGDIIGKSRFKMASTRTIAAIPAQEAATLEKGIELSEEEATFDDGNTETASRPAQVPEEKLDGEGVHRHGRHGAVRENDGRLFGDRHPHQGAYRDPAEETRKGVHRAGQHRGFRHPKLCMTTEKGMDMK